MKTVNLLFISLLLLLATTISAQKDKPIIRFGLIADIQYADIESERSRFYRNSLPKLEESISWFNTQHVDFTINLGDMIDRDPADFDTILTTLKKLNKKIYHLTGNHDYKGITENESLYKKLDMPSEYYYFKKKNWIFIMLNTNEIASYSNIKGTDKESELTAMKENIRLTGGKQGDPWNGGVSAVQLAWLDRLLADGEKSGYKVLLFTHHPLYPQSAFTALNNVEILELIDKYSCVKTIFSGHHHEGGFGIYNHIPAITTEGMVETENENAFGVVEIYKDKIVIEGKGRMTSRVLR